MFKFSLVSCVVLLMSNSAVANVTLPQSPLDRKIVGSTVGDFSFESSIGTVRVSGVKLLTQFENGELRSTIPGFDIEVEANSNFDSNSVYKGFLKNVCDFTSTTNVSPKSTTGISPRSLIVSGRGNTLKGRLEAGVSGFAFPVFVRSPDRTSLANIECKQLLSIKVNNNPIIFLDNNSTEVPVDL